MRSVRKTIWAGLIAFGAFGTPSLAQTPPEQIRDWPGLTYQGVIGGLEAWTVTGSDALFMRAPDGRSLIRGEMFSANGRDLGAALLGVEPAQLRIGSGPDWSAATPELIRAALTLSVGGGFSVRIGEETAPEVWAWMDPSSPASAATYMMLRDKIEAGELALQVIPVVTSEPGSSDLMRRLLSQPGPIGALRDQIRGTPLPMEAAVDEAMLGRSEGLISRIVKNGEIAAQLNPPGLPFLLWTEEGGAAAYAGIPNRDLFGSVIPTPPVEAGSQQPVPPGTD